MVGSLLIDNMNDFLNDRRGLKRPFMALSGLHIGISGLISLSDLIFILIYNGLIHFLKERAASLGTILS